MLCLIDTGQTEAHLISFSVHHKYHILLKCIEHFRTRSIRANKHDIPILHIVQITYKITQILVIVIEYVKQEVSHLV